MRLLLLLFLVFIVGASAIAAPSIAAIRSHLIEYEGYRDRPYRDGPSGYSVGIGHSLTGSGETPRARYTKAQIEAFFLKDVSWSLDSCRAGIKGFDDLPESVQLVAIGVCFGVGRTGFARFVDFRFCLSHRMWNAARTTLYHSRWRTQVGEKRAEAYLQILDSQS